MTTQEDFRTEAESIRRKFRKVQTDIICGVAMARAGILEVNLANSLHDLRKFH